MPAQLGLFGPSLFEAPSSPSPPGFAEREEAIARVREHAPDEWKAAASLAIRFVAARQDEFTTDRVWAVLAERGVTAPAERRAMGAAMRDAAHLGWIAPTDRAKEFATPAIFTDLRALLDDGQDAPRIVVEVPRADGSGTVLVPLDGLGKTSTLEEIRARIAEHGGDPGAARERPRDPRDRPRRALPTGAGIALALAATCAPPAFTVLDPAPPPWGRGRRGR